MATSISTLSDISPVSPLAERVHRPASRLAVIIRNSRHIERLLRNPEAIGPDAAASLVRTVNVVVEPRCNLVCRCCHYRRTRVVRPSEGGFDLSNVLQRLREVPDANIGLTGGEPLLSPVRVVGLAVKLLRQGRQTGIVTSALPIVDGPCGESVRNVLLNGIPPSFRAQLSVRCSVDLMHQDGSGYGVEEYVRRCHQAVSWLAASGWQVLTRSIVTTGRDYAFFKAHVLPLAEGRVTRGATVQPDMYNLPLFVTELESGQLGDVGARLGSDYLRRVRKQVRTSDGDRSSAHSPLRTAPWALVEINERGVRGPSGFVNRVQHHGSVLAMLRSYDWLRISDAVVPQITIANNARPYLLNRRNRSVSLNVTYLAGTIFEHLLARFRRALPRS